MSQPGKSTAPSTPLASEIPVELPPEAEEPKASSPPAEATKSAVSSHEPPGARATKVGVAAGRTALAADAGAETGGSSGADTEASQAGAGAAGGVDAEAGEAGAGGGSSLAHLEPSRPGDRLMFDPFRATRDRSSGGGIRMLIDSSRLRHHPIGVAIGRLLARVDATDLFGPSGIDPIRDTERIFVYAPNLADSNALLVIVQHRIAGEKLRARLDELVESAPAGSTRLEAGLPVARSAHAPGNRFFVTPKFGLLIVAPEAVVKSAERMMSLAALPSSPPPSAVWVHIETPSRALFGMPLSVPKSVRWIELLIVPDAANGMTIRFEAEDDDERSAPLDARDLAAAISDGFDLLANTRITGVRSPEQSPSVELHVTGSIIVGTCRFTEAQVADLHRPGTPFPLDVRQEQ